MKELAQGTSSTRALPFKTRRTLDGIFFLIVALLLVAASVDTKGGNIFRLLLLPLDVPNTTLFELLTEKRAHGLTAQDLVLRIKLLSLDLRRLYLRYGSRTIAFCGVCNAEDFWIYTAHHVFLYILIPHSLNMLLTGFIISRTVNTASSPYFRIKVLSVAVVLFVLDTYIMVFRKDRPFIETITPLSFYAESLIFRPVVLALYNYMLAVYIYYHAAGRFAICPFTFSNR